MIDEIIKKLSSSRRTSKEVVRCVIELRYDSDNAQMAAEEILHEIDPAEDDLCNLAAAIDANNLETPMWWRRMPDDYKDLVEAYFSGTLFTAPE